MRANGPGQRLPGGDRSMVLSKSSLASPVLMVDASRHFRHRLRCWQSDMVSRPVHASGWELWMTVLPAAEPPGEDHPPLQFVTTVWSRWQQVDFPAEQIGRRAWYRVRWVGKYRRKAWQSSWSQFTGAVILG